MRNVQTYRWSRGNAGACRAGLSRHLVASKHNEDRILRRRRKQRLRWVDRKLRPLFPSFPSVAIRAHLTFGIWFFSGCWSLALGHSPLFPPVQFHNPNVSCPNISLIFTNLTIKVPNRRVSPKQNIAQYCAKLRLTLHLKLLTNRTILNHFYAWRCDA